MALLYEYESYMIRRAAFNVHGELGAGFAEKVYQDAFEKELIRLSIPYRREAMMRATYRGELLDSYFKADFLCYDKIIVELKALTEMPSWCKSQTLNYLKIAKLRLAFLINFALPSIDIQRIYRYETSS